MKLRILSSIFFVVFLFSCSQKTYKNELYFGRNSPNGEVTEQQWEDFMNEEISNKLEGFTVIDGKGFWSNNVAKVEHEKSKILIYISDNKTKTNDLKKIKNAYLIRFNQESVLWVRSKLKIFK